MTGASRHRGVTRGPVRSATGVGPLLTGLIVTAVILTFLLSDQLLTQLGVPYVLRGGGTLAKIQPSTYLAVAAVLLALLLCGDPVRLIADWTRLRPIYVGYIIVVVIITVYLLGLQGTSGLAFIADTLLRPALLALLLLLLEFRDRARLFSVLIGILALNSAIGILEVATGWRLG